MYTMLHTFLSISNGDDSSFWPCLVSVVHLSGCPFLDAVFVDDMQLYSPKNRSLVAWLIHFHRRMGRPWWVSAFAFASNDLKHMMVIQTMRRKENRRVNKFVWWLRFLRVCVCVMTLISSWLFDGFTLFTSDEFMPFAFSGNVFVRWSVAHFRRNLVPIMPLLLWFRCWVWFASLQSWTHVYTISFCLEETQPL